VRRPPTWLIALTLAVYPPVLRDRYGLEIADLLHQSDRPWRDLSNVAWAAAWERASVRGSWRGAPVRPYAVRAAALGFAPMVFFVPLYMSTPVTSILAGAIASIFGRGYVHMGGPDEGLQMGYDDEIFSLVAVALVVAPVAVVAVRLARRWTDALRIPAPAVVVPTMLVLGSLTVLLPLIGLNAVYTLQAGQGLDPGLVALPVAAAVWWVPLTASAVRYRSLTNRGRTGLARAVAVVATVAAPVLCGVVYVLVLPESGGPLFGFACQARLPPLAAVCTPFAFALLRLAARGQADPAGAAVTEAG
jgi:hypothetical protein